MNPCETIQLLEIPWDSLREMLRMLRMLLNDADASECITTSWIFSCLHIICNYRARNQETSFRNSGSFENGTQY